MEASSPIRNSHSAIAMLSHRSLLVNLESLWSFVKYLEVNGEVNR